MAGYKTEQENFWAGEFGADYISRNQGDALLASNLNFFSRALSKVKKIESCIEFGANIGMNLKALKLLYPSQQQYAVEINKEASIHLEKVMPKSHILNKSIIDFIPERKCDLVLIKGVLIHINPDQLRNVYKSLVDSSSRYLLIAEYYNPTPVEITYRGHGDRLFKRDFAGEILDCYSEIKLIDYGFAYHRDLAFPQDDITWFLFEKR